MASATRVAATIHKWLALLLIIPILFWFVSGLFFALAPIETVRSEHRIARPEPVPVALVPAAAGLNRIAARGLVAGDRIELRSLLGRPVALVARGEERPLLFDLESGRRISPVGPILAARIAERDHDGAERARDVTLVRTESPEYRGMLPAWRVDFDDGANRSLYVAVDSGLVTARRSTLWRTFDFLWSLHILDFKNHEDFNTPLLAGTTAFALVMIVAGIVMFPSRLGYTAWRRRRALNVARKSEPVPTDRTG